METVTARECVLGFFVCVGAIPRSAISLGLMRWVADKTFYISLTYGLSSTVWAIGSGLDGLCVM